MMPNPPQAKGLPVPSSAVHSAAKPRPLTPATPWRDPISVKRFAIVAFRRRLLWMTVKICFPNNFIEEDKQWGASQDSAEDLGED